MRSGRSGRYERAAMRVAVGLAIVLVVTACGSATRISEGSEIATRPPAPAPTTSAPTTSTTAPPPACPQPSAPAGVETTIIATPTSPNLPFSAVPGGPTVGKVVEHWGGPSSRPVLGQQDGWVQIRLATRPNGSFGWVPASDVTLSQTPLRIVVSICNRSLTLFSGTSVVYSAPVGVGRPQWPTPIGPTFVDSIVATPRSQLYIYGPTVLILGVHSNVFTEFDGGDGTVAIHGYPSDPGSTRGVASSHGCIRVSATTINQVQAVPVGTPVDIVT